MTIDLSNYVRVGLYDLPEPTRTAAPSGNLLGQESSGVTYNWDTNTLFIVGDGGTSVTQVSLTGELIDTMTLAAGVSPQGTEFYDTESITYVGNGQFVFTEERYRQVVQFTYDAGSTLTRANAQTVDLGTDIGNVGLEGITYDPLTGGFVLVKEKSALGIFQTTADFANGTASNGSASTVDSVNLFDPSLAGLSDFSDVYALSSNAGIIGTSEEGNLLILSQESGKIVEVDRAGNILSSLTLQAPSTPTGIDLAAMTVEGMTMGPDGTIYLVSEEGGGDFNHPQLWVYAPSAAVNSAPTALGLSNAVTSILENTSTASRVKVADLVITDDGLGTNAFTVTGADAAYFEADSSGLYIKAGTVLDYETKTSYSVTVNVDDATLGSTPDASTNYALNITNIVNEGAAGSVRITEVVPWSSGSSPVAADWFELTNVGTAAVSLTGWKMDDNSFAFANAVSLNGVTSVAPGESVIFIETASASVVSAFRTLWNVPANVQIGTYSGSGVGLSTGGDGVVVFDSAGTQQAKVSFGASPAGPYPTFDNAALTDNASISTLSAVGTNGAYAAPGDTNEVGSPGTLGGVAAPTNHAPTAVGLTGEITSLAENTSTASRVKVASVIVNDDGLGTNNLAVTGADAAFFEVDSTGLYIKAGTVLDFETKANYAVSVTVDDSTIGNTPDASVSFSLSLTDVAEPTVRITEVAPWSSGNSPVGADWFEVTNTGAVAADITGWKMDDSSNSFANAAALSGVASIGAGKSAIFIEASPANAAAAIASFINTWFGGTAPAGLQIGTYSGSGVGLSTGGDGVNLFNAAGVLQASVSFGASPAGPNFATFDNAAGLNNATLSALSAIGANGGFTALADAHEIGSPGTTANHPPVLTGAQAVLGHGIEDTGFVVSVADLLTGFSDPDGHVLSVANLAASAGTVVDNGDGTFTVKPNYGFNGAMSLSYDVTDGVASVAAGLGYTVDAVVDAARGAGPSSSAQSYLVGVVPNVSTVAIATVGDVLGTKAGGSPYVMVGIPDGLGAFDNGDGTFTLLMNQELTASAGIVREHGATGAFVSQWVIDKTTLHVVSAEDAIKQVYLFNDATQSFDLAPSYAMNRLCSADLAPVSAYYWVDTKGTVDVSDDVAYGTQSRIYMTGEEGGTEGKEFAVFVTGPDAGKAFEFADSGLFAWENNLASSFAQKKTITIGQDDGTNGQVYVYVGEKQATGSEFQKAGLEDGHLYGIKVTGLADGTIGGVTNGNESDAAAASGRFTMFDQGVVGALTGTALDAQSEANGVTSFNRPEDGHWDPTNPNVYWFVTTASATGQSRLYKMTFDDITQPELGGSIEAVLDSNQLPVNGTVGPRMMDNITVTTEGKVLIEEDIGNNAHLGRIFEYDPATDTLKILAVHDGSQFVSGQPGFLTQDEEASGIIDVTEIFGRTDAKVYLTSDQVHTSAGNTEQVEKGQLVLMTVENDAAQVGNAAPVLAAAQATIAASEDTAYTVTAAQLLQGIVDADGDAMTVSGVVSNHGTVVDNGNGTWTVTEAANYNGAAVLSYSVSDGIAPGVAVNLAHTITAVNDAPSGLALTNSTIAENRANGTVVGTLVPTDVDNASGFTYTLLDSAGGRFYLNSATGVVSVGSGSLLDYETATSHTIDVQVKDAAGATYHQVLTINLTNVVENQTYTGTTAADTFTAPTEDNWTVNAKAGNDVITTLGGADVIFASGGNDTVSTGGGNDTIYFTGPSSGFDSVDGGAGSDTILVNAANTVIGLSAISGIEAISSGGFADARIQGSAAADILDFSGATLTGIGSINGGGGNDTIIGSSGNDTIVGAAGKDLLTGGAGADTFVFKLAGDSTVAQSDHIIDFASGIDLIDLSALDANTSLAGNQAFTFIGSDDFSGLGQVRVGMVGGHVAISANLSGNLAPDLMIILDNNPALNAGDLIL